MKKISSSITAIITIAFILSTIVSAFADSLVSISPAFADWMKPYIDATVNALILALIGYFATWLNTRFKVSLDASMRDGLTKALQNQAGSLIADGMVKMQGAKVDVHSGALKLAAQELMASVPDAADHFGLTPDAVATRIVDTIPQIAAGAQMIAKSTPAQATTTSGT